MGTKIVPLFTLFGLEFTASVSLILFPLTFLITDILTEVYGRESARTLVRATLIVLTIVLGVTALATVARPAERFAPLNDAYVTVFRSSLRITIASIVAFGLAQTHDVWAFEFWKQQTGGRYLWLRNNLSTLVSQFIDTVVFMLIAFWGISPQFTLGYVLGSMVPPYYLLKALLALFDTPLVYVGVNQLRRRHRDPEPQHRAAG